MLAPFFSQKILPKFLTLLWTNWMAWEGKNFIKSRFMLIRGILLDEGMLSCGSITSTWRTWSSRISRVVFRSWLGCGTGWHTLTLEVLIVFERCYEEGSVSMEADLDDWMAPIASSPGSPNLFNVREKRLGEPGDETMAPRLKGRKARMAC